MTAANSAIIFWFLGQLCHSFSVYKKLPEFYGENERSHLEFPHIKKICGSKEEVCKSNDTHVCTVRVVNGSMEYKNFENACFLFLYNMCEFPGEEYHIIEGILCETLLRRKSRRRNDATKTDATVSTVIAVIKNATDPGNGTETPTDRSILREEEVSRVYDIDTAFDFHACPYSCPDTYSPVCVSANRGEGKYFKFYTFVNHCQGDVYYCKHYSEFGPPPDAEEEDVNSSGLGWSYCGAFRYIQFARFSELLSSMGHYGWLAGNQRYSAILEPQQRQPGYG